MTREIKFRQPSLVGGKFHSWHYWGWQGDSFIGPMTGMHKTDSYQFTGLLDKNGKEIYEGDILRFFSYGRYVQQSFAGCRPEIDEAIIQETIKEVQFMNGMFGYKSDEEWTEIYPLEWAGIDLQEALEFAKNVGEDNPVDIDGTPINESIVGIEVIGNIHENPELLTK